MGQSGVAAALNLSGLGRGGEDRARRSLKEQVSALEREIILQAIQREGSLRRAARALQVDHSTLVKKCRHYGQISGEKFPQNGE